MAQSTTLLARPDWIVRDGLLPYPEAVAFMEDRAEAVAAGRADEMVWLG